MISYYYYSYSRALVHDIAIVTISGSELQFSNTLRSACLPYDYVNKNYETFRKEPTVVGWGATRNNGGASTVCRTVCHKNSSSSRKIRNISLITNK